MSNLVFKLVCKETNEEYCIYEETGKEQEVIESLFGHRVKTVIIPSKSLYVDNIMKITQAFNEQGKQIAAFGLDQHQND